MEDISDNNILYPAPNLVVKRINDFYVVLNPNLPNIMVVDDEGKDFFKLCDGANKVGDILKNLCLKRSSSRTTKEEIMQFTSSLIKSGFISTEPPSPPEKKIEPPEKLKQIYLHLTRRCNLSCKHCYIKAGMQLPNEMTTEETINLVKDFATLGGENMIITGGEPLLRRQLLYQVIETARDLGIRQVNVETNGTLIKEDDARFFRRFEVNVGVSLGGATPESHGYIRGEATFETILSNVKMLVAFGVHTRIGMTFARPNLNEAKDIVYLAKKLGVESVTFNMVVMTGRAKENPDLAIGSDEIIPTVRKVREASREVEMKTFFEELASTLKNIGRRDSCGAGVRSVSITPDGDVYPCNSFIGGPMRAGNIREQSLEEIWRKSKVLQEFQNLSVLDIEGCRDCEIKFICAGGCLAESFRELGSIKKQCPYCTIYNQIYSDMITELATELWKQTCSSSSS